MPMYHSGSCFDNPHHRLYNGTRRHPGLIIPRVQNVFGTVYVHKGMATGWRPPIDIMSSIETKPRNKGERYPCACDRF